MNNYFKNNKGVSYVEMLVVIAIIAVVSALVGISMGVVNNANLNKASSGLQAAFASARAQSMARGSQAGRLHIYSASDGIYYQIGEGATERLCNNILEYATSTSVEPANIPISGRNGFDLTYYFDSSGMVKSAVGDANPTEFVFRKGNRCNYVFLYKLTGKTSTGTYYL